MAERAFDLDSPRLLDGMILDQNIEERWATVEGARMRYLHSGSGPALILLHGLLGYSFSWRFTIPALAQTATVYAVDMPGAGFSERCPGLDSTLRGCGERLLRFARQADIKSFDLLGTSHGGAVAMMAAALGPNAVRRLILVAPVNPWSAHGSRLAPFLSGRLVAILLGGLAPAMTVAHGKVLGRLYGDRSRIAPGTLEGYSKPFRKPGSFEYPLQILSTWKRDLWDLEAILPKITDVPTLLIWGTCDAAVDPDSATLLCRQFRHCRLVMLDGVGHLPYEETPDDFNRAVLEFLSPTPAQPKKESGLAQR